MRGETPATIRRPALAEALVTIGAPQTAALVGQACALFPGGRPSPDRDTRQDQLEALDALALAELDRRFLEGPEPLGTLLEQYFTRLR